MNGSNASCDCCSNELNLERLCVDCIKGGCGKIRQIISDDVCSQSLSVKNLFAENEVANNLCVSGSLQASQLSANVLSSNSLCAKQGTINQLCVDNLTVGNLLPFIKYRATINYGSNSTYSLGSFLNFNNVIDDPNGNISLSPNTTYTAPVAGYYMMTLKVNASNLVSSSGPILGVPVANPEIYVNGVLVREAFSPFLAFFNTQKVILDSLITLQAGDQVTMKYNVLGGNGVLVSGTVDIAGAGLEDGNSLFKIILLSSLSQSTPGSACAPCPTVSVSCQTFVTPCQPSGATGKPCDIC